MMDFFNVGSAVYFPVRKHKLFFITCCDRGKKVSAFGLILQGPEYKTLLLSAKFLTSLITQKPQWFNQLTVFDDVMTCK